MTTNKINPGAGDTGADNGLDEGNTASYTETTAPENLVFDVSVEDESTISPATVLLRRNPVLHAANDYYARGWRPVPIVYKTKKPIIDEWQDLVVSEEAVGRYFRSSRMNVGVALGVRSNGLTDVDLDCEEAVYLAPEFLPPTKSIFGRAGKRRSHHLYRIGDAPQKAAIKHVGIGGNKKAIIELRLGGGDLGAQTVFPASIHKDTGEKIEWDEDGEVASSSFAVLDDATRKIAAATILIRTFPAFGGRHNAALAMGGFLSRTGWVEDDVQHFVELVARHGGSDDPHARARDAVAAVREFASGGRVYGFPGLKEHFGEEAAVAVAQIVGYNNGDDRPVIRIEAGEEPLMAKRAEEILVEKGVEIYQRGGKLVRATIETIDGADNRSTRVAQLREVGAVYLRNVLSKEIRWEKFRPSGVQKAAAPLALAEVIIASVGDWIFRSLKGVITTPTMRADGTILGDPGYDLPTGLLLVAPPDMSPIKEAPTKEDALEALTLLDDLLSEFPFTDDVARSVALSALITPIVRGAFAVAPMHVTRAPVAASGKSYLNDVVASLATGQRMPVLAAGRSEEETEKRLGSALIIGQPLISIDNVNGELGGDFLCQAVERHVVDVRPLGRSELIRIEARGTTMYATGNNITIVGDMCRRVITANLDPQSERPEQRVFAGNPVATVLADRGAYIAAALTICRAYIIAGRPDTRPPLASYEGWSDTVRSALTWLGKADPVDSQDMVRAEDPHLAELSNMLAAWADTIGVGAAYRITLTDVIKIAEERPAADYSWPDLHAAVEAASGSRRNPATFFAWVRGNQGRIVDGFRLVKVEGNTRKAAEWYVDGQPEGPGQWQPDASRPSGLRPLRG